MRHLNCSLHGRHVWLALASALWLLPAIPAQADEAKVVAGDYAPYVGDDLPQQGFSSELVREAFRRMGRPLALTFLPWKRAYEYARQGEFEASFPWARNAEREASFIYSQPLHIDSEVMFVRADAREPRLEMMDGHKACIPDGWSVSAVMPALIAFHLTLERPSTLEDCFRMLNGKRVDAVLINEFVGWDTARKVLGAKPSVRVMSPSLAADLTYLIAPRSLPGSAALIEAFDKALAAMRADGTYDRIRARWLPE